jgi:hypothetical protein
LNFARIAISTAALMLAASCGKSQPAGPSTPPPPTTQAVSDFVTALVAADGSVGARMTTAVPAPAGGPGVTATASGSVSSGGSDLIRLVGSPFRTIYMSIDGADGFYQIQLPGPTSDITISASLAAVMPRNTYTAVYRVAMDGIVGATASIANTVRATSTTSAFVAVFGENPVPFRSTGCNVSVPTGWYTTARLQETSGVAFTVSALTQKLDGNVSGALAESFNSRFGPCTSGSFNPGTIPANGAVCASVGVCTNASFGSYQFEISGTDANAHAVTFASPLLQFGARSNSANLDRILLDRILIRPPGR